MALVISGGASAADSLGVSPARLGTVETIAGPGFCDRSSRLDSRSAEVRALAVDPAGQIYVDSGPPQEGVVVTTDAYGRSGRLVTGAPTQPVARDAPEPSRDGAPIAGRLVTDGRGGIILTTGSRIVSVDAANGLSTLAGDPAGRPGETGSDSSGDGGPATAARFVSARAVAADEAGNLFIADRVRPGTDLFRIRVINRGSSALTFYLGTPSQLTILPGEIQTVAGRPGDAPAGDGGDARLAVLAGVPPALAVAGGRLYVAAYRVRPGSSTGEASIRVVNLSGAPVPVNGVTVAPGGIQTVARGQRVGPAGRADQFSFVPGIAADDLGNLLVADEWNDRVLRLDRTGELSTVAGAGGHDGNGLPAREARLRRPFDVKLGGEHRVYISDQLDGQVRFIDGSGTIRLAPGADAALAWTCEGNPSLPERARPGGPAGVAADAAGSVFIALPARHQVKRIDGSGSMLTAVGGSTECSAEHGCGSGDDGGPIEGASLDSPTAITATPQGNLYILDENAGRVRYANRGPTAVRAHGVLIAPGTIRTVAGDGRHGGGGDGGPATRAQLGDISGLGGQDLLGLGPREVVAAVPSVAADLFLALGSLAVDPGGDLFIADPGNHRVRRVDAAGIISTVAGEGAAGSSERCCHDPMGVATDAAGNLYVSDRARDPGNTAHPRVWALNRTSRPATLLGRQVAPDAVEAVAGNGNVGLGDAPGPAVDAPLLAPQGIALDRRGSLFLAEEGGVVRVDTSGTMTTVVGTGQLGFNGDGFKGRLTSVGFPAGVAVDRCGNLLVADLGGDRVRRLDLVPGCAPLAAAADWPGGLHANWTGVAIIGVLVVLAGVGRIGVLRRRRA